MRRGRFANSGGRWPRTFWAVLHQVLPREIKEGIVKHFHDWNRRKRFAKAQNKLWRVLRSRWIWIKWFYATRWAYFWSRLATSRRLGERSEPCLAIWNLTKDFFESLIFEGDQEPPQNSSYCKLISKSSLLYPLALNVPHVSSSLRASSPIWASEASLARTRERGAAYSRLRRSLARSRENRFTRPNRRSCSQDMSVMASWSSTFFVKGRYAVLFGRESGKCVPLFIIYLSRFDDKSLACYFSIHFTRKETAVSYMHRAL